MILNCIPIPLFSPEISFVTLKLDLRMKGGEGKAVEFFCGCIQKHRDKTFNSLLVRVVCSTDRAWERTLLCFYLVFLAS